MAHLDSPVASPVVDSDSFSSLAHLEDPYASRSKASAASAPSEKENAPKPPEEPSKPKRGRGRPRKHSPPDQNPPKRGRGRPKKNPVPAGEQLPKPEAAAVNTKRTARRQARETAGNPTAASSEAPPQQAPSEAPPSPVKRKRGRPKKVPAAEAVATAAPTKKKEAQTEGTDGAQKPAAPNAQDKQAVAEASETPPVKRKRGRPKRVVATETKTTVDVPKETKTTVDVPKETTDGQTEQPPKRKRGRPKKNTVPDTNGPSPAKQTKVDPPQTKEGPPQTKEGPTQPPKRKRGRPKKVEKSKEDPAPQRKKASKTKPAPEFHLASFEASSSDGEAGGNVASLVSRNGVLQEKERKVAPSTEQQPGKEQGESSDSSYTTPDP